MCVFLGGKCREEKKDDSDFLWVEGASLAYGGNIEIKGMFG